MGILRHILKSYLKQRPAQQHFPEIATAIELLVDEVNPRMRFISGFRGKLHDPVWNALRHIHRFIGSISGPVDCSRQNWVHAPLLRALFTNAAEMNGIFSRNRALHEFLSNPVEAESEHVYAVLAATRQVRKVLGMAMRGEVVQREVPQTMVSFSDHAIALPAASERELRAGMEGFALSFLAHQVLQNIAQARAHHDDLEQERALLRSRLRMILRQEKGMQCLCGKVDHQEGEAGEICTRIGQIEKGLQEDNGTLHTLDYFLDHLIAVLEAPEKYLKVQPISLCLNDMNISIARQEGDECEELTMSEVSLTGQPTRVMMVARVPRGELIELSEPKMDLEQALKML